MPVRHAAAMLFLVLAACGTSNKTTLKPDEAQACNVKRDSKALNRVLEGLEGGASAAAVRAEIASVQGELKALAEAGGNVRPGSSALGEVACYRTSVIAYSALMSLRDQADSARVARKDQAARGQGACGRLSPEERAGSGRACDIFDIIAAAETAEVEAGSVFAASTSASQAVAALDAARQSLERFEASVLADWRKAPAAGPFAQLRQEVLGMAACTASVGAGVMSNATGSPEIDAAARAVARARQRASLAAIAELQLTPSASEAAACDGESESAACQAARQQTFDNWCFSRLDRR